jgi:hypothetical protein
MLRPFSAGAIRCAADPHLSHVLNEAKIWPEMAERRIEWMEPKEAARRVHEAGLATLFLRLAEVILDPPKLAKMVPKS